MSGPRISLNAADAQDPALTGRGVDPVQWISSHVPRSQAQLEAEVKGALKFVFWAALLAPVIIVPAYYLLVAFGLLPPVHLPG